MVLLEYIRAEWAVLKQAPLSFFLLAALSIVAGFGLGMFVRGQELANMESLLKLKDGELDELKSIEERLKNVETKLSAQQLSSIRQSLQKSPSAVSIVTGPKSANPYFNQIQEVFKGSGWTVKAAHSSDISGSLVLQAPDEESSAAIEKALTNAGVNYQTVPAKGKPGATEFYLGTPSK
jgi:hypothetical protein